MKSLKKRAREPSSFAICLRKGEKNMSKIVDAINNLPDVTGLVPATEEDILSAEKKLGLHFSEEYKELLRTFGAVMSEKIEILGICSSRRLNVVDATKRERRLNPEIPGNMYIIENIGIDGALMMQSETGEVYITRPELAPIKKYDSLTSFVENLD